MTEQNEFDQYITPDGETYNFSNFTTSAPRALWAWIGDGLGAPDVELIEQQGPYQDGTTLLDYRLPPRDIILMHGRGECSRQAYWDARADLLNYLRPNRGSGRADACGVLRKIMPDGTQRDIKALAIVGPRFAARHDGSWRETTFEEQIRFHCPDPILYDPTAVSVDLSGAFCDDLVFPYDFGYVYCAKGTVGSDTVTYTGTWLEFPVFYVTGPLDNLEVVNLTTDETLSLAHTITDGVTVTIDLRYGHKTVVDSLGNNLIGSLSADSDLATWHLAPDPEAAGGVNTLSITGSNTSSDTALRMVYYRRYYGI